MSVDQSPCSGACTALSDILRKMSDDLTALRSMVEIIAQSVDNATPTPKEPPENTKNKHIQAPSVIPDLDSGFDIMERRRMAHLTHGTGGVIQE